MNAEILHDALNLLPGDLITPVDTLRSAPRKPKLHWMRYGSIAACLALMLWGSVMVFQRFGLSTENAAQMEADMEHSIISGSGDADGTPAEDMVVDYENAPTKCECAPEYVEEGAPLIPSSTEIAVEPPATGYPSGPDKYYVGGSASYSPAPGYKEGVEYPQTTVIRSLDELQNWFAEHRDYYDIDSFEAGYAHLDETFFTEQDMLLVLLEEENGYICHEPYFLNAMQEGKWQLTFTAQYQEEDRTTDPIQWLFFIETEKGLIEEGDSITVRLEPYSVAPDEEYVEGHTNPTDGE